MTTQSSAAAHDLLITQVRPSRIRTAPTTGEPVDLRIRDGVVTEVGQLTPAPGEPVLAGEGRWVIPGLWDQHVHLTQWAQSLSRLDVSGTESAEAVCRIVADHLASHDSPERSVVIGTGYRSAAWWDQPTVAQLDAVSGSRPVVLISGDCHNGWLNSAALDWLGLPARTQAMDELEWFGAYAAISRLPEAQSGLAGVERTAVAAAAGLGVVGIVDLEFGGSFRDWPGRFADGVDQLRVRASTYADDLDEVIAAGLRTGAPLDDSGLLTMGPLKIISDGSLNTRTAHCCEPYADVTGRYPRGKQNYLLDELSAMLSRATGAGLECAVHAIGDAAVATALDAFAATGARGSIEHAQLMRDSDIARLARSGLRASVQPAHLIDDRDVAAKCWPDRGDRCFRFATMAQAGVPLALGSDAPVARLDPWSAMAAAVHRSGDQRDGWYPQESLTVGQALAASTDGQDTVTVGSLADLALLDDDPYGWGESGPEAAGRLRAVRVAATVLAGRVTHQV